MMKRSWQIQEVKQRLSEVIRLAVTEGPQKMTYRGEPQAWIISDKDYLKLVRPQENLVDFFTFSSSRY